MISASLVQLTDRIRAELAVRGPMTCAGLCAAMPSETQPDVAAAPKRSAAKAVKPMSEKDLASRAGFITASNVYLFPHLNRAKRASRKQITADTVSYPAENLDKRSPTGYNVIT